MLTAEQEKMRAIKISKLYEKNSEIHIDKDVDKPFLFPTYQLWKLTFILLIPIVADAVLVILFLGSKYNSTTDIKSASIAFIAAFIVISLLAVIAIRFFRQKVSSLITNERYLFWLIIIFLLPLILLVKLFFDFSPATNDSLLILKLSMYSLVLFLLSSGYILVLAYILEKNEKEKRYLISGLLAVLPGLVYGIISGLN